MSNLNDNTNKPIGQQAGTGLNKPGETANRGDAQGQPGKPAGASVSSSGSVPFPTAQAQNSARSNPVATVAKQATAAVEDTAQQAEKESQDLMQRLVSGAHAAIDKLADAATPATDKLSKAAGQASDMKDQWVSDVRDIVRENPIASIAAAIAVGVLYVKLTSTSRSARVDRDDD